MRSQKHADCSPGPFGLQAVTPILYTGIVDGNTLFFSTNSVKNICFDGFFLTAIVAPAVLIILM
jgi:hypothetical protein